MRAAGHDDAPLRGPKYTMCVWLCGPLPLLAMWVLLHLDVTWCEPEWGILLCCANFYAHVLCLLMSLVVMTHGSVWRCVEGWLLAVYWVVVAVAAWGVTGGRDLPFDLVTLFHAAAGVAGAMAIVFVIRTAAAFRPARNA